MPLLDHLTVTGVPFTFLRPQEGTLRAFAALSRRDGCEVDVKQMESWLQNAVQICQRYLGVRVLKFGTEGDRYVASWDASR
ncbi:uncharacterized protein B0I36DRAFT_316294 [Microdochium trichocladiopsis]|uniref:Uncharacterized protein n=1 Tax=Microdochium trichocladiopsis TaxID=1682393 RepID=A0A9P8YFU9_9PEZI|nr:uncharacterized protein B0I36DRAFT_316294 [Microdochium trichocladiopsis]KAH7038449.1 hypothetical protein B0I36DRAFT_316294 [Microdochium trichocladiopsis]